MNARFFAAAARQWNRVLICAMQTHAPATQCEAAKRKREASMKRAKAYKAQERALAQVRRYEADRQVQEYANAI